MKTASQIVHALLGGAPHPECADLEGIRCWVCAAPAPRGMPIAKWMGANFTGQNKVKCPSSVHVCEPCVSVMQGRPPDTLRMYSILVEGSTLSKFNKGNKGDIRAFLRRPHAAPWIAAIADSGQKHIVPWTPVNSPGAYGGSALFEETIVQLPRNDAGWALVDDMTALLTAGSTKEGIGRGDHGVFAWQRCPNEIRAFEAKWERERGSAWWELALWLSQRDEAVVQARMAEEKSAAAEAKKAAKAAAKGDSKKAATPKKEKASDARRESKRAAPDHDGRSSARGKRRVPADVAGEHPQALGHDSGPDAPRGADVVVGGGVGDVDKPESPAIGTQLGLF